MLSLTEKILMEKINNKFFFGAVLQATLLLWFGISENFEAFALGMGLVNLTYLIVDSIDFKENRLKGLDELSEFSFVSFIVIFSLVLSV